jgi:hypothetical protein
MSRGLLWSAYSARNGLNNSAGTPTIILPLNGAPDVSQELRHGKLREWSEDTQKLCAYPARLIKDAASYEPCYFSSGQICNGGVRYYPTICRDQREDIRSASCALLPRPFVELDEYQTSGSWSLGVNLVLDAFRFVILLLPEQHHWRAVSGNPLNFSTKRCSESNLLTWRVTMAQAGGEMKNNEITGCNLTAKTAHSQQLRLDHVQSRPKMMAHPDLVYLRSVPIKCYHILSNAIK